MPPSLLVKLKLKSGSTTLYLLFLLLVTVIYVILSNTLNNGTKTLILHALAQQQSLHSANIVDVPQSLAMRDPANNLLVEQQQQQQHQQQLEQQIVQQTFQQQPTDHLGPSWALEASSTKSATKQNRHDRNKYNRSNSSSSNGNSGSMGANPSSPSSPSTYPTTRIKQVVPPSIHAAWDEYGKICILAKFQATFTIEYETTSGTVEKLIDKLPANARSKGRCDQFDELPVLDIMWKDSFSFTSNGQSMGTGGFTFRMIFEKISEENQWGVQQMQLLYNTGHPIFRGAREGKKKIVRSIKGDKVAQFRTLLNRSMLCPSPPPIKMYDSDGKARVMARLSNMQIQAFDFKEPTFSPAFMRCEQVSFGSGVAHTLTPSTVRSDSLTFAIGLVTVFIASATVAGYAFYRAKIAKKYEYKTMI